MIVNFSAKMGKEFCYCEVGLLLGSPLLQTEILTCTELCHNVGRPKRLFVFVNPFGGKKSAAKIFNEQVKPLLEDAQIEITVQGALIL